MIGSRGYCEVNTVKHDYISMSDDELERLSEKKETLKGVLQTQRNALNTIYGYAITMKSAAESARLM